MKFEEVACNICGGKETRKVGRRVSPDGNPLLETNIIQCPDCGIMYPNPMPRFTDQEVQKRFSEPEKYFSEPVTATRIGMYDKALGKIEGYCPRKGRILDVGCGRGEFLYAAMKRGWQATGTDVSRSFADFAGKNLGIRVMVGPLAELDLPGENFDVVSLNSVIQYLPDPMKTLVKINELLKPSGVLYIETTNEDAFVFRMADLMKNIKGGKRVTTHLSPLFPSFQIFGFNRKAILKALRQTGFEALSLRIRGLRGGGTVQGSGFKNLLLNIIRRLIILTGGITGRGHLIYCVARKEGSLKS